MVPDVRICNVVREKRYTSLSEGADVHIQQHIHRKDLNSCLLLYCIKPKQAIQLCYGAYKQMKQYFQTLIYFWFQWIFLSNLFLMSFWKFPVLYSSCLCMIFYFKIQLTLSHFKSILMNKKSESANTTKYIPK